MLKARASAASPFYPGNEGMDKCSICGRAEYMPYICRYCGENFCSDHRLPENHACRGMTKARPPRLDYTGEPRRHWPTISLRTSLTSSTEVKHLLLAWLVISFSFSMRYLFARPQAFPIFFGIILVTAGSGFVLHELAHKFMAQRYGYWSEFRASPYGLLMALVFAVITAGGFIFAAPGATLIGSKSGYGMGMERRAGGIISVVGPIVNIVLAGAFYLISFTGGILGLIGVSGMTVNLWLAAFNLIPIPPLDGQKVFSWSVPVWIAIAVPAWIAALAPFLIQSLF